MITITRSTMIPAIVIREGGDTIRITSPEEADRVMDEIMDLVWQLWAAPEPLPAVIEEFNEEMRQRFGFEQGRRVSIEEPPLHRLHDREDDCA